ncbi:hypothetical protein [Sulfurimonas sp.]|uniref:hypothetical protein n=1 Tax=Sulfurimonas sp. TaxID=2022749 RepID=UPI002B46870B|nr:hypothetical protein [Sulfurimonas sp.]
MLLPIISFYVFKNIFKNMNNTFKKMYLILFSIIVLKFIFDVYFIYIQNLDTELILSHMFTNIRFSTTYYFLDSIRIYNYFDYFSFIYYVAVVLSLHNITNNIMLKRSLLLIVISGIVVLNPNSRLFIYGVYLIPALYLFYVTTRLRLETYFYLFMTASISITFLIGFVDFNLSDISLSTRNNHAYNYFSDFNFVNIVLPFDNQYRMKTTGSFHNELLEIFSFFGVVIIYYYYLVMKIYSEINKKYKLVSFLLMFIIVIGALVQINISNPYIGIMLGMILAVLSLDSENMEQKYAKQ